MTRDLMDSILARVTDEQVLALEQGTPLDRELHGMECRFVAIEHDQRCRFELMELTMRNLRAGGVNVEKILTEQERTNKDLLIAALEKRLLQANLAEARKKSLREFLDSKNELDEGDIRDAIRLVMSTQEYQVT